MDRGASWVTIHGATELDVIEHCVNASETYIIVQKPRPIMHPKQKGLVHPNQEAVCRKILNIIEDFTEGLSLYFYYPHKNSIFKYMDTSYQTSNPKSRCKSKSVSRSVTFQSHGLSMEFSRQEN